MRSKELDVGGNGVVWKETAWTPLVLNVRSCELWQRRVGLHAVLKHLSLSKARSEQYGGGNDGWTVADHADRIGGWPCSAGNWRVKSCQ
ncbi:MAG: hypothetical protein ACK46I_05595 [Phycisphaerae bacterium]